MSEATVGLLRKVVVLVFAGSIPVRHLWRFESITMYRTMI